MQFKIKLKMLQQYRLKKRKFYYFHSKTIKIFKMGRFIRNRLTKLNRNFQYHISKNICEKLRTIVDRQ
jgi:hypothetical protein